MRPDVQLTREEFDALLAEYRRLIDLANQLEYCLYRTGTTDDPAVRECQQAAGALIGCLRDFLFRQDQQIFPVLEGLATSPAS